MSEIPGNNPEDYLRAEYWQNPEVQKGVMRFLGSSHDSWDQMGDIDHEYLAVANRQKMNRLDKHSPASVIEPESFPDALQQHKGQLELHASLWQKESVERPGLPRRVLFVWDIDLYNKEFANWPLDNPEEAFGYLEASYQLMSQTLQEYNIPHVTVASGRGYHFITQVPDSSPVMDDLLQNVAIEPTIMGRQGNPPISQKRRKVIPPASEAAHLATGRLQQYLFNQVIRNARQQSDLPVEISDKGPNGIAFDNTAMLYSVENRTFGVPGTPYFIKPEQKYPFFNRTAIRTFRSGPDFELSLVEMLQTRANYQQSEVLLSQIDTAIPDGSRGIGRLMAEYQASDLKKLHEAIDSTFGDHPVNFADTYRKYGSIAAGTSKPDLIKSLIDNANDALLSPDNIDAFGWEIFKSWGGSVPDNLSQAPHVAGMLRAIYEDPQFGWGNLWDKRADPLRYARGWVTLVLGQALEQNP
jgi:hypothetical protein